MPHFVKLTCSATGRDLCVNLDMAMSLTALDEARTIITFGPSYLIVAGDIETVVRAPVVRLGAAPSS